MWASAQDKTRYDAAQSWAQRRIAFRYPERYRELYLVEKGDGRGCRNNSIARTRATRQLGKEHPDEYRRLREQRLAELKEAEQW